MFPKTTFPATAPFHSDQVFFGTPEHPTPMYPDLWAQGHLIGVVAGHGVYAVLDGTGRIFHFYCVQPGALHAGFSLPSTTPGPRARHMQVWKLSIRHSSARYGYPPEATGEAIVAAAARIKEERVQREIWRNTHL